MPTDTACIHHVGFLKVVLDPAMFRDVPIREMDVLKQCVGLFVDVPSHDAHL